MASWSEAPARHSLEELAAKYADDTSDDGDAEADAVVQQAKDQQQPDALSFLASGASRGFEGSSGWGGEVVGPVGGEVDEEDDAEDWSSDEDLAYELELADLEEGENFSGVESFRGLRHVVWPTLPLRILQLSA